MINGVIKFAGSKVIIVENNTHSRGLSIRYFFRAETTLESRIKKIWRDPRGSYWTPPPGSRRTPSRSFLGLPPLHYRTASSAEWKKWSEWFPRERHREPEKKNFSVFLDFDIFKLSESFWNRARSILLDEEMILEKIIEKYLFFRLEKFSQKKFRKKNWNFSK